jgi:hypothetical protein
VTGRSSLSKVSVTTYSGHGSNQNQLLPEVATPAPVRSSKASPLFLVWTAPRRKKIRVKQSCVILIVGVHFAIISAPLMRAPDPYDLTAFINPKGRYEKYTCVCWQHVINVLHTATAAPDEGTSTKWSLRGADDHS